MHTDSCALALRPQIDCKSQDSLSERRPSRAHDYSFLTCVNARTHRARLSERTRPHAIHTSLQKAGGNESSAPKIYRREYSDHDIVMDRNLVVTVSSTLMMQSTHKCRSTKDNSCVWSQESRKFHALLYWIACLETNPITKPSSTDDDDLAQYFFLQLLLQWLEDAADKSRQLIACFTLFELLQLRRSSFRSSTRQSSMPLLSRTLAISFTRALQTIIDQGYVATDSKLLLLHALKHKLSANRLPNADSARKPTKLGLAALETLIAVCSDASSWFTVPHGNLGLSSDVRSILVCEFDC